MLRCVAQKGEGVAELIEKIDEHRAFLQSSEQMEQFERNKSTLRFETLLRDQLYSRIHTHISASGALADVIAAISRRELDPYSGRRDHPRRPSAAGRVARK